MIKEIFWTLSITKILISFGQSEYYFQDIFYCRILQRDVITNNKKSMQCGVMYRTPRTDTNLKLAKNSFNIYKCQ